MGLAFFDKQKEDYCGSLAVILEYYHMGMLVYSFRLSFLPLL